MVDAVFLWCLILSVAGVILFRAQVGSLSSVSLSSFFYGLFMLLIGFGAFSIYLGWNYGAVLRGQTDPYLLDRMLWLVCLASFLLPLGMAFHSWAFGYDSRSNLSRFENAEIKMLLPNRFLLIGFAGICALVLFVYSIAAGGLPIVKLIQGASALELVSARSDATNNLRGADLHHFSMFLQGVLPFVSFCAFSCALVTKRYRVIATAILLLTVFALVADLKKAPLLKFFLGAGFVFLLSKRKPIRPKAVLASFLVLATLGIGVKALFMKMEMKSLFYIVTAFMDRVIGGQVAPLYYYLKYFPDYYGYLGGSAWPNPAGFFPHNPFPLTTVISNQIFPENAKLGIVGSAPTTFFGIIYASFGVGMASLSMLIIGFFMRFVDHLCSRFLPKTPIGIALFSWIILHYSAVAGTSPLYIYTDMSLIAVLGTYFCLTRYRPVLIKT